MESSKTAGIADRTSLTDPSNEFKALLERLARLAAGAGYDLVPYEGTHPKYFEALANEVKKARLDELRAYVEVCESITKEGGDLNDSIYFLKCMLARLGLRAEQDALEKMTDEDVLEVYSQDNTQLFRNFRFFKFCTYTIDELICRPWWEMFRRSDEIIQKIFISARRVLGGEIRHTYAPPVEKHTIVEIASAKRLSYLAEIRYFAPLLDRDGAIKALLCIERGYAETISRGGHSAESH